MRATRSSVIVLGALGVLACGRGGPAGSGEPGGPGAVTASKRPNVLILVGDDVGAHLGCHGVAGVETPRLDQLAREGVRFTHAYAPTGVCAPSRATLLTGLEPARHGALGFEPVRPGVATFGPRLGGLGYRTGLLGKLGAKPLEQFPFDWMERTQRGDEGARDLAFHVSAFEAFLDVPEADPAGDGPPPFAFIVNFRDAHWPLPTDGAPADPAVPVAPHDPARVEVPPVLMDTAATRAELARYHDALRRLDATAGALLDVLERRGLAQDTVVLFTSDNGPPFPRAKTTLYEWGVHQAFLVRWPGVVAPGRVDDRLVSLADVLPTALDLAGAPEDSRADLDGRSLVPLLRGADVPWRNAVFGFHGTHRAGAEVPARSVRTERWRYIWNPHPERDFENLGMEVSVAWSELVTAAERGDKRARSIVAAIVRRPSEELYDLNADPWELENLVLGGAHAATLAELRATLGASLTAQVDPLLGLWPH
jgi:N-sulfoglucosamine sulfohydrolase